MWKVEWIRELTMVTMILICVRHSYCLKPWNPNINGTANYLCPDICDESIVLDKYDRCCACKYEKSNSSNSTKLHVEIVNVMGHSIVVLTMNETDFDSVSLHYNNGFLRHFPSNLCDFKQTMLTLDLANNLIGKWTDLSCLGMLETLNLNGNKLTTFPNSTFIGMYSLRRVDFSNNKIKTMEPGVFTQDGVHLFNVDLTNNGLKTLDDSNVLLEDRFFCTIDYSRNQVAKITHKTGFELFDGPVSRGGVVLLRNMTAIQPFPEILSAYLYTLAEYRNSTWKFKGTYDISYSPLQCDCKVARLLRYNPEEYFRIYKVRHSIYKCGSPPSLQNKSLTEIAQDQSLMDIMTCEVWDHCPRKCKCIEQPSRERLFIDCSNQSIRALPGYMPESMFPLDIDLSNNLISEIGNNAYLSRTSTINLENNAIQSVGANFLNTITMVTEVNVENNRISFVDKDIQSFHPDVFIFNMTEIKCDCSSEWIKQWRQIKQANKPFRCRTETGNEIEITSFSFEKLVCDDVLDRSPYITTLSVIVGVLLLALMVAYYFNPELLVLIIRMRRKRKQDWNCDLYLSFDEENIDVFVFIKKILKPRLMRLGYTVYSSEDMLAGQTRDDLRDENMRPIKPRDVIIVLSDKFDIQKSTNDKCWVLTEFECCWKKYISMSIRHFITLNFDNLSSADISNRKLKAIKRVSYTVVVPDRHNIVIDRLKIIMGNSLKRKQAFVINSE